jgi:tetratricopeptide (TPR) repeat protein
MSNISHVKTKYLINISILSILILNLFYQFNLFAQSKKADYWEDKAQNVQDPNLKIEYYTKSLAYDWHPVTFFNRGEIYYFVKDFDKAIKDFSNCISLVYKHCANNLDSNLQRCLFKYNLSQFLVAELQSMNGYSSSYIQLNTGLYIKIAYKSFFYRGKSWFFLDKYAEAISDFSRAIKMRNELEINFGDTLGPLYYRGCAKYFLGDINGAIEDILKSIEFESFHEEKWESLGKLYFEEEKYSEAINAYLKAIKINPNSVRAIRELCGTNLILKNYKDAIVYCAKAIELDSNESDVYAFNGFLFEQLDDRKKAIEYYSKAIDINPSEDNAYLSRGDCYLYLKEYENALKDYKTGLEIGGNNYLLLVSKHDTVLRYLIEDLTKEIQRDSKNDNLYHKRALLMGELLDYEESIHDLNKSIELNPKNFLALFDRGYYYYLNWEFDKALNDINNVIILNPEYWKSYPYRVLIRNQMSQDFSSVNISDCEKAIELYNIKNDTLALIYIVMADEYFKLNDYPTAVTNYNYALSIDSVVKDRVIQRLKDKGDSLLNNQNFDIAILFFSEVLKIEPGDEYAYYKIGLAKMELKDYISAKINFSNALNINYKYVDAFMGRGLANFIDKNYYLANIDFIKVIEFAPDYSYGYYYKGLTNYFMNRIQPAIIDFKKAIELNKLNSSHKCNFIFVQM